MSIGEKLVIVFGAALTLILPTFTPMVYAVDVPSTVEIEALTCGLEFSEGSATSIDYGSLFPDEISSEHDITVNNTGNSDGALLISGTDWNDVSDVTQMFVNATHFGTLPAYEDKLALTSTPDGITVLQPGGTATLTFQLKAVLENPGFSGAAVQQVTLSTEC